MVVCKMEKLLMILQPLMSKCRATLCVLHTSDLPHTVRVLRVQTFISQ